MALVHRRTAELLAQSSTEIGVTLATLILTLLVLTFLTRWLAGQITRPLAELGEGMKNSDLTLSLKANSQDEIGEALLLKVGLFRV